MKNIVFLNFNDECSSYSSAYKMVNDFKGKGKIVENNGIKYEIVSKGTNKFNQFIRCILQLYARCFYGNSSYSNSVFFAVPLTNKNINIEHIVSTVWHPNEAKHVWQNRGSVMDTKKMKLEPLANKAMWKNALKAIKEHSGEGYVFSASTTLLQRFIIDPIKYLWFMTFGRNTSPFQSALPDLKSIGNSSSTIPLKLSHTEASVGFPVQDARFYKENFQGTLCGIFDGHGGQEIAKYASRSFENRFEDELIHAGGNVRQAFETLFFKVQTEVARSTPLYNMGSTAVVSFIDKKTNIVYTATLGDSEASIYRMIDGQMKSIPLSCVRDLSCRRDAARAAKALNNPAIANAGPVKEAKGPRVSSPNSGVNVSRGFGYINFGYLGERGMTHKPKITMNQLKEGDVIILACSELKGYVPEKEIVSQIALNKDIPSVNLARHLVNYAVKGKVRYNNVSVVAIQSFP